mgnify:CR=1 FL=1|jgi:hypothetical protein
MFHFYPIIQVDTLFASDPKMKEKGIRLIWDIGNILPKYFFSIYYINVCDKIKN